METLQPSSPVTVLMFPRSFNRCALAGLNLPVDHGTVFKDVQDRAASPGTLTVFLASCRSRSPSLSVRPPIRLLQPTPAPSKPAPQLLRQPLADLPPPPTPPHPRHRPHHPVPRLRRHPATTTPSARNPPSFPPTPPPPTASSSSPKSFLHGRILRPLPPGGLSPVAPVRSLQQLPRALVPEERQHAHRREGRPVLAPLRRLPQPRRPLLRRSVAGHAQEAPLRAGRRHLLHLPRHPVATDTTGTGSYVMGVPAVLVDEKGAPVTGPVSDSEILAHLDRHSTGRDAPAPTRPPSSAPPATKPPSPARSTTTNGSAPSSVYDEWQGASFTKQSPLPFYRKDSVSTCQTCHMVREPLPATRPTPAPKTIKLVSPSLARRQHSHPGVLQVRRAGSKGRDLPQKRL